MMRTRRPERNNGFVSTFFHVDRNIAILRQPLLLRFQISIENRLPTAPHLTRSERASTRLLTDQYQMTGLLFEVRCKYAVAVWKHGAYK